MKGITFTNKYRFYNGIGQVPFKDPGEGLIPDVRPEARRVSPDGATPEDPHWGGWKGDDQFIIHSLWPPSRRTGEAGGYIRRLKARGRHRGTGPMIHEKTL